MTDPTELIVDAMAKLDAELDRRIAELNRRFDGLDKLTVELQLCIDDLRDDRDRAKLLKLLDRLDEDHSEIKGELEDIGSYDLFDPIRVVLADLREQSRASAPA